MWIVKLIRSYELDNQLVITMNIYTASSLIGNKLWAIYNMKDKKKYMKHSKSHSYIMKMESENIIIHT